MRPVRVVLVVAVVVAAVAGQSFAAAFRGAKVSKGARAPKAASVVWFSGESSQGLEQDRRGNLLTSGQRLPVRKRVRDLYAAAYYAEAGVLVTVDGKAVTRLYERRGTRLELTQRRPPHEPERIGRGRRGEAPISPYSVRFSRIPGLVYLTWAYPRPKTPLQTAWTHAERLELGDLARGWHAVPAGKPRVQFLEYAYQVLSPRSVRLSMPGGERIALRLPAPLAGYGPAPDTDAHWEPVTVIRNQAIICQTTTGWSKHDFEGRLTGTIVLPAAERERHRLGRWRLVFYHGGQFYAADNIPGPSYYRLNFAENRMARVPDDLHR
jgi:hypothetical protein